MTRSVLLIISGSIAAYKSLDVIRRLRERGVDVRCILTKGGEQFVTPLSVAALSGNPVYSDLFSLKDEVEMGHIRLSREVELIVVAPASADLIAKMAHGAADDLATAALLASNKKILVAPAMNTQMWQHPATQRNIKQIVQDGATLIEPGAGMLACGETGAGRMAEPEVIVNTILRQLKNPPLLEGGVRGGVLAVGSGFSGLPPTQPSPLKGEGLNGFKALVTSGPTHEAIDPVRYIGNRSSGKQGHAIAAALARHGVEVTLVTGPTALPDPVGVTVRHVMSAEEMLAACKEALPADIAVCAAAVADWRVSQPSARKLKKTLGHEVPELHLIENPDILAHIAAHPKHRPSLVIGFAAETDSVMESAAKKLKAKGCDWIVANDVSEDKGFNVDDNTVSLLTAEGHEDWPVMSKETIAERLVERIAVQLEKENIMTIAVKLRKLSHGHDLPLPHYATAHSAGMDLMAAIEGDIMLKPMERRLIPAGIAIALPEGYEAQIRPRSGLALKHGIALVNAPGTIDADYRGEIKVLIINLGQEIFTVTRGMRIAQMVVAPVSRVNWQPVEALDDTTRSDSGFGSTGFKAMAGT